MNAFRRKHSISKCHMVHTPAACLCRFSAYMCFYWCVVIFYCCRILILHSFHSAQRQGAWVVPSFCPLLCRTISLFLSSGFFSPNLVFGSRYLWHVRVQAALLMIKLWQPQTLPATNDSIDLLRQMPVTMSVHRLIKLCYWDGKEPAQPAAFRCLPCWIWLNKVRRSFTGCNTTACVAMQWLHYRKYFKCRQTLEWMMASSKTESIAYLLWLFLSKRESLRSVSKGSHI